MFDLQVRGAKKLNKKLNSLSLNVARKTVRPALRHALEPITDAAKSLAPVDSGRLRRTIRSFVKNSRRFGLTGGVITGTRKQLRIPQNAKYYYPTALEFGTKDRAPRSFMRAAMKSKRREALKRLGNGIAQRIKRL